jgi:hypothetical protein
MINGLYGTKTPEAGDKGAPVFAALEGNIQAFINHTHNGTDAALIPQSSISRSVVNLSTSWTADPRGFKQTVTCPGTVTLDKVNLRFRVRSGALLNHFIIPTVIPASLVQFDVYVNDSTLSLECLFV